MSGHTDTREITAVMYRLAEELKTDGKVGPSKFFKKKADQIGGAKDSIELKSLLEEVYTSYSISQYANFSEREERLFDELFSRCNGLLKVIEKDKC